MEGNLASKFPANRDSLRAKVLPIATYTLIHAFLTKRSHPQAAEALKKAAKDVVILKDNLTMDGPQLDEIIREWKLLKESSSSSSS
jgi:hypothetical protein